MRQWWTLAELAEQQLPGLPATRQGLAKLAARDGWLAMRRVDGSPLARLRPGRGGGREFHVSLLPAIAQANLLGVDARIADEVIPDLEVETAKAARVRDARLAVVALARAHAAQTGFSGHAADAAFAAAYNAGLVEADAAVRALVPHLCGRTLRNWRRWLSRGDGRAIASKQGRQRGLCVLSTANGGAVATYIGALIIKNPFFSSVHIRNAVEAKFGAMLDLEGQPIALPGLRTFTRFVTMWRDENRIALAQVTDPDRFRSHHRVAGLSRHAHVERPNQTWQIDASPADVLCLDGRHSIYVLVDVWSRRMMTFVTRTPRAQAVKLLLRKAILAWGVPDLVETDNGSDFKARAVSAFLAAADITHVRCDPYSPDQKGVVERAIGTLQRDFATMLPGFIGHNVADRKQIEARRAFAERLGCDDAKAFAVELTAVEMADYLDRWAEHHYGHKQHSSLAGLSPFAKAASYAGKLRRIESVRALDVLLMDVADGTGVRTVGKQGIRVDSS